VFAGALPLLAVLVFSGTYPGQTWTGWFHILGAAIVLAALVDMAVLLGRRAWRARSPAAQRSTDQYFHGMAFNSSGKLVVGAYDRSYGNDETTGFSDISVLTSANLKSFNKSQRVTTASMPPATDVKVHTVA